MLASASSRASLLFLLVAGLLLVEAKSAIDKAFCGDLDCYTILNVTSDATRGEIKRGYHQMSLKYHPDKLHDRTEEEQAAGEGKFVEVSNAYALLTDLNERKSYDMWVRGGRKRRPTKGEEGEWDMPDYYRDDSVRGVQDTPLAFAGVILTLLISVGIPLYLTYAKGPRNKPVKPPGTSGAPAKGSKGGDPQDLTESGPSRKERRAPGADLDGVAREAPAMADIAPVSQVVEGGGGGGGGGGGTARAITKVSGPWSPEEETLLIKAVRLHPGGILDRWLKVAEFVGTRTEEDCIHKSAQLKNGGLAIGAPPDHSRSKPSHSSDAPGRGPSGGLSNETGAAAVGGGAKLRGGRGGEESMSKLPVAEFAKRVREAKEAREKEAEPKGKAGDEGREGEKGEKEAKATRPWKAEEQALLENAMRVVDKSVPDRWDRVAEMIPARSRKEVVQRVKDLKAMLLSQASVARQT